MKLPGIRESKNCHLIQMSRRHLISAIGDLISKSILKFRKFHQDAEIAYSPLSIFVIIFQSSPVKTSIFSRPLKFK